MKILTYLHKISVVLYLLLHNCLFYFKDKIKPAPFLNHKIKSVAVNHLLMWIPSMFFIETAFISSNLFF